MTILEAIQLAKQRKTVKRTSRGATFLTGRGLGDTLTFEDIEATDWEVEVPRVRFAGYLPVMREAFESAKGNFDEFLNKIGAKVWE